MSIELLDTEEVSEDTNGHEMKVCMYVCMYVVSPVTLVFIHPPFHQH